MRVLIDQLIGIMAEIARLRDALSGLLNQLQGVVAGLEAVSEPAPAPPPAPSPVVDSYWMPTTALNFRTGPGTNYAILRTLTAGERLGRLGEQSGWFKLIDSSGLVGWSNRSYLTVWQPARVETLFGGTVSDPWDYNSQIENMVRQINPGAWVVVTHGGVHQQTLEMLDRVSLEKRGQPMLFLIRPLLKFDGAKTREQIYAEFNAALDPLWPYLGKRMHIIIYNETNLNGDGAREGYKVQWPDPNTFGYAFLDAGLYLAHRYPGATLHYPAASPVPITGVSGGTQHYAHNEWVAQSSWAAVALAEHAQVAIDVHTYVGNGVSIQAATDHVRWVCEHFMAQRFGEFHVTEFANGQRDVPKAQKARDLVNLGAALRALPYPIRSMCGYTGYASTDYYNQSWLGSEMIGIIAQRPYA